MQLRTRIAFFWFLIDVLASTPRVLDDDALLPRVHAQGIKQSVLSVVVTKITRSQVIGICACCNYHESVDLGEKLVTVCFELLDMAHYI